ncbi:MAG: NADH-quinone oxidoreductase subunit NuoK [Deltaproteobacteria bacterium]|nr:NADH-quinone oxidoreductase subunit NuoK [Deltaproteobacteria bacterium]
MTPHHFLALSGVLFLVGAAGVLVRRNALIVLMSLEIMLNAANLALVAFSRMHGAVDGQVAVFLIMAVAAGEVAIGLAIIVNVYRLRHTIQVDALTSLKN